MGWPDPVWPATDGLIWDGLIKDGLTQDGLTQDGLTQDGLAQDGLAPMPPYQERAGAGTDADSSGSLELAGEAGRFLSMGRISSKIFGVISSTEGWFAGEAAASRIHSFAAP